MFKDIHRRNTIPIIITLIAIILLILLPNKFPQKIYENTERVSARVISTDENFIVNNGLIKVGDQLCEIEILQGKFKGRTITGTNRLSGSLEQDKLFKAGDKVLVTVDYTGDTIRVVTLVDHYRLNYELLLVGIFVVVLVSFAGIVGIKSILSFIFTVLAMWKVLIPLFLLGYNPIIVGMVTTLILICVIIGLVYGLDKRSLAAILGSISGALVTCFMALFFVSKFKIHGAVMSFSESLLYSGYESLNLTKIFIASIFIASSGAVMDVAVDITSAVSEVVEKKPEITKLEAVNLNLTKIFIASIFIASSGAVMDVAVDITSAVSEVVEKKPEITKLEAVKSGINVGRSIMGTMMTTLLLAYSGGYIGLLMVFMAQGTPIIWLYLKYVLEIIKKRF